MGPKLYFTYLFKTSLIFIYKFIATSDLVTNLYSFIGYRNISSTNLKPSVIFGEQFGGFSPIVYKNKIDILKIIKTNKKI